ncbi:MAG: TIGR03560 family F420-dependent LLM class oxidoreductase [Chloroflexi bacterium]|nr:TIGR03560 family F420-dependent LLM class oxidoreductase [Chloroflexota bacterium]
MAEFGIQIEPQFGFDYSTLRDLALECEILGFNSMWLSDHLFLDARSQERNCLDCWTTLAALAAETTTLRLGSLVSCVSYRFPSILAKTAATVDVISGGRLELGIGAGGGRGDHLASGIPFPSTSQRVDMLEEAVELIKRLWVEDKVDFAGRYYHLKQASVKPAPVQKPHPPVIIGGHGETYLLGAVAKHADICNIGIGLTLEEHRQKLAVLEQHCQAVGRDFSQIQVSHNAGVLIAETSSDLERRVIQRAQAVNLTPEEFQKELSRYICGTPDQCVRQIQEYVEHGISYFFLIFPDPVSSLDLRLFAEEVMPRFQ